MERKLSNILLKHAYEKLLSKDIHEIPTQELMESVGWSDSKNDTDLKKALKSLVSTNFQFNIFKKDKTNPDWMCSNLLAAVKFKDGICFYQYPTFLKEILYQPRLYARLDVLVSNQFKNKYSLSLWEYFRDYIDTKKTESVIQTDWISIDSLIQDLLQLKNNKIVFKELNLSLIHI